MPIDRINLYLHKDVGESYVNTKEEAELLNKFLSLYTMALSAKNRNILANNDNIAKWRKAYLGTLNALNSDGEESKKKSRQVRKVVYEFVESKIDNSIPKPKMVPRYKRDTILVQATEEYLKYHIDTIFTKYLNDRSERATYVDGTSWYKVWWDSTDSSHVTNGSVKIDIRLADQIIPQPAVTDYRDLQYIFELQQLSVATIYDLFGRVITPTSTDSSFLSDPSKQADLSTVTVITCYYINDKGTVGRFAWCSNTMQVICNEDEWQIRKLRICSKCGEVVPRADICPVCGSKSFKWKPSETEELEEDLYELYNPYLSGDTDEKSQDKAQPRLFLSKGTQIPYYKVRQLPFVPRPAVSAGDSLYGISEAFILLEMQDGINKMLTKVMNKSLKSGAVITKFEKNKLGTTDDDFKVVSVKTAEEAAMLRVYQVEADTTQEMTAASILYESAKNASGVTNSFQGKEDPTATSGVARQVAAQQSAGRIESLRVMKAAAFAGVYELVLKYLLAFSDEPRSYVRVLPDGQTQEEEWSKYLFLDKDKYGDIYYRDDFQFSSDAASTLSTNRVAMWQETQDKFINGMLGNPQDPRTIELYWNMMAQQQYPLSELALAGIKDNSQHLPPEVEQAIMQSPELMQMVMATIQAGQDNRGGARPNSGPQGNGATHSANVERTNERNRSEDREVTDAVQGTETGGII